MPESFQEKFCRHFKVPAERYGEAMMQRTLYRRARCLQWLLSYDFLSADRSFIASVGRLTRRRDFSTEVREFQSDAHNRTFWRRIVRLRVSSARMHAVLAEAWPEPAPAAVEEQPVAGLDRDARRMR